MNEIYTTELLGLGTALTELAVKGTATAISSKIKAIKEEKMLKILEVHMMKLLMNYFERERKLFALHKRINQN